MDKLIHLRDVAEALNLHQNTVRRLVATGQLRAIRISPRGDLRFRAGDVDAYLESRETVLSA